MSVNIIRGEAEDGGFILNGSIHITRREMEALATIARGYDNEEAARRLGITYTTFRNHAYNVMRKLDAKNRTEALVKAVGHGMIYIRPEKDKPASFLPGKYYVCSHCGRAFNWSNVVIKHREPVVVNHVEFRPAEIAVCPYNDCRGDASESWSWEEVRKYHPEYPDTPKSYTNYPINKLLDAALNPKRSISA